MMMRSADADRTDGITLDAIETAIRESNGIEEWHRDMLLAEVRSLEDFYLTRVRQPVAAAPRA